VSSPSFSRDEIRAAAEIHHELGPDYRGAVIESFLDKVGQEIDARVDARVAAAKPAESGHQGTVAIAVLSLLAGIPLTAIVLARPAGLTGLLVIWIAIAVINVAYAIRPPRSGR
jgi:hypothetical protein